MGDSTARNAVFADSGEEGLLAAVIAEERDSRTEWVVLSTTRFCWSRPVFSSGNSFRERRRVYGGVRESLDKTIRGRTGSPWLLRPSSGSSLWLRDEHGTFDKHDT